MDLAESKTCIAPSTTDSGVKCWHQVETNATFCPVHGKKCSQLYRQYKSSCNKALT